MLSKVSLAIKPLSTITASENVFYNLYNNDVNCTIIFRIQPFPFLFFAIFGNSSPPSQVFKDGRNVFKPTRINQVRFPNLNVNSNAAFLELRMVVWAEFISLQICVRGIDGDFAFSKASLTVSANRI